MKRYRSRLDHFIRSRVPADAGGDILRLAEQQNTAAAANPDLVWDYVEMRETMLDFVATHVADEIFEELQRQFWFDDRFVTKEMVAERCLTFMILGPTAIAAE
jgi:hypothetical protein